MAKKIKISIRMGEQYPNYRVEEDWGHYDFNVEVEILEKDYLEIKQGLEMGAHAWCMLREIYKEKMGDDEF